MSNANMINLGSAMTQFEIVANEIFGSQGTDAWKVLAFERPLSGKFLELNQLASTGQIRQLVGSQVYAGSRAYAHRGEAAPYSLDFMRYSQTDIMGDSMGLIANDLKNQMSQAGNFWYRVVISFILGNPVGIDKVSLFNDSHPYGPAGATWDNKTANVLSPAEFAAGIAAMRALRLESGLPAMISPTHLVVSPKYEKLARELCMDNRVISVSSTGTFDAAASIVAAGVSENYVKGQITVIVEPLMLDGTHDDDWFLLDASKGDARPVALGILAAPKVYTSGQAPQSASAELVNFDTVSFGVRGHACLLGAIPHVVYGRMS